MINKTRETEIKIKVESPNLYYARLLLEDYAGQTSELTASTQYFNHEGVLFKKYPEVSKVLREIGDDEIIHLNILSRLIALLGINPKYRIIREDNLRVWWCPNYVKYEEDLLDIIKVNIQSEKDAIKQYQYHVDIIDDKYVKEMLRLIILKEKEHLQILTKLYEDIKNQKYNRPNYSNQISTSNLEKVAQNQQFTIEEIQQNYNGKDGKPSYVVVDNIVFDVTNNDEWQNQSHHGLYSGDDHTEPFYSCHGQKLNMLKTILPIVGYIKE